MYISLPVFVGSQIVELSDLPSSQVLVIYRGGVAAKQGVALGYSQLQQLLVVVQSKHLHLLASSGNYYVLRVRTELAAIQVRVLKLNKTNSTFAFSSQLKV